MSFNILTKTADHAQNGDLAAPQSQVTTLNDAYKNKSQVTTLNDAYKSKSQVTTINDVHI